MTMYAVTQVPDVIPGYALLEIARDGLLNRSIAGDRTPEEVCSYVCVLAKVCM